MSAALRSTTYHLHSRPLPRTTGLAAWCGDEPAHQASAHRVRKRAAITVITAIVIPVDPAQPIRQQHLQKRDVDAYRAIVGGNLQIVNLERPPATMYLNEEGKYNGLRVNDRATTLLSVHNAAFRGRDVIAGTAFLVGVPDQPGDDTSVPDDLVDLLFNTPRYRVQMWTSAARQWGSDSLVFINWWEAYRYAVQLAESWSVIEEVRVVPELDDALREQWYQLGVRNHWIREANDPPFTRNSFVGCFSVKELEDQLGFGNWSLGTAFYYRDLCFINQINGGDEWLTIRHGIAFESITIQSYIEDGEFASLIARLLIATKEQCQRMEY